METLVDQDFGFNKTSLKYGQFLQEVHETCPGTLFTDVSHFYPWIKEKSFYVHVAVPERLAVILKLRFGDHLCVRPPPKEPDPDEEYNSLKNYASNHYIKKIKKYSYYEKAELASLEDLRADLGFKYNNIKLDDFE